MALQSAVGLGHLVPALGPSCDPAGSPPPSLPPTSVPPCDQHAPVGVVPASAAPAPATAAPSAIAALVVGSSLAGRWRLTGKIGKGAFGDIFEAASLRHERLRSVAVKVEALQLERRRTILKFEAAVLKRMQDSLTVPRFFEYGKDEALGVSYLAMEKLGDNLLRLLKAEPSRCFSLSTVLRLGIQCIEAVRALHDCGFLHRDIKPSNFVISNSPSPSASSPSLSPSSSPRRHCCRVIDFGLAKCFRAPDGSLLPARTGVVGFRGTPRYASVFVHQQLECCRRDDLWSLIYMLLELLFGQLPWSTLKERDAILQVKLQHVTAAQLFAWPSSAEPSSATRTVPACLHAMLQHAHSLRYEDRPNYEFLVHAFQNDLEAIGAHWDDPYDWELSSQSAAEPQPAESSRPALEIAPSTATVPPSLQSTLPAGDFCGPPHLRRPASLRDRGVCPSPPPLPKHQDSPSAYVSQPQFQASPIRTTSPDSAAHRPSPDSRDHSSAFSAKAPLVPELGPAQAQLSGASRGEHRSRVRAYAVRTPSIDRAAVDSEAGVAAASCVSSSAVAASSRCWSPDSCSRSPYPFEHSPRAPASPPSGRVRPVRVSPLLAPRTGRPHDRSLSLFELHHNSNSMSFASLAVHRPPPDPRSSSESSAVPSLAERPSVSGSSLRIPAGPFSAHSSAPSNDSELGLGPEESQLAGRGHPGQPIKLAPLPIRRARSVTQSTAFAVLAATPPTHAPNHSAPPVPPPAQPTAAAYTPAYTASQSVQSAGSLQPRSLSRTVLAAGDSSSFAYDRELELARLHSFHPVTNPKAPLTTAGAKVATMDSAKLTTEAMYQPQHTLCAELARTDLSAPSNLFP